MRNGGGANTKQVHIDLPGMGMLVPPIKMLV